ncbi:hypothetical protein RHAB21_02536 [Pseudorhizobium halotolerans]|uniref:Uncharacterized protein n=1 Tax=Pseudorhizobium halotolerans TaxID=1233081 RepID=A0ABM8PLJ8_9HYPH|nr:hypothetical protein [Pseudorhizobium halotolerans]CAD7036531.1 hypothetical protein RHAB21_02536 [Pseudorhizobium halotolerans]
MTSKLLPITEELRDAVTRRQRAEWLCTVPEGVILREHLKIRALLKRDGFPEAEEYLSALVAKINARRLADGRHTQTVKLTEEAARGAMMDACRGEGE